MQRESISEAIYKLCQGLRIHGSTICGLRDVRGEICSGLPSANVGKTVWRALYATRDSSEPRLVHTLGKGKGFTMTTPASNLEMGLNKRIRGFRLLI